MNVFRLLTANCVMRQQADEYFTAALVSRKWALEGSYLEFLSP